MDRFSQDVFIADHQHDLRQESMEHRRRALLFPPLGFRARIGRLLIATGTVLVGSETQQVRPSVLPVHPRHLHVIGRTAPGTCPRACTGTTVHS